MKESEREKFISRWGKYFGDAELPTAIYFSDKRPQKSKEPMVIRPCIIELLSHVRAGKTLCFSAESRMCGGAKRYLGFVPEIEMRDLDYFLSYGIPGKVRGERYKESPEIVRQSMEFTPPFKAPKEFIVFKRWDKLTESDEPEVVVFLAGLDVIAGLFTLANYDEAEPNGVICPFGSGCASIVYHPFMELRSDRPRCVLGMFDISARPYVGENTLSFAAPITKFREMVENMDESFLTTGSWKVLRKKRH